MTLRDLYDWHCEQGDRWHRLSEEEQSCAAKVYKESRRRTYARKAAFHRYAAECLRGHLHTMGML